MKVYLSGFPYIPNINASINISFKLGTGFRRIAQQMDSAELSQQLDELNDYDLWVIRAAGDDPYQFILRLRILGLLPQWKRRRNRVVFWSMDNHHQAYHEVRAIKYFDKIYFAHQFDPRYSYNHDFNFLPCAHNLGRLGDVIKVHHASSNQTQTGLTFPFRFYPAAQRNLTALHAKDVARRLGIDFFVGRIAHKGEDPSTGYVQHLASSHAVLNASLMRDLNMRAFEALALGRVMIVNDNMQDLQLLSNQQERIVTYKPGDRKSLEWAIKESQSLRSSAVQEDFFLAHSLDSRLLEILRDFGVGGLKVDVHGAKNPTDSKNSIQVSLAATSTFFERQPYSDSQLLSNLGIVNFWKARNFTSGLGFFFFFAKNLWASSVNLAWKIVRRSVLLKSTASLARRPTLLR